MTLAIPPSRGLFGTVRSVAGWTVDTATLGPDVDALLNVFRDVREGLVGIPGFKFFRKRGEQMIAPEHQPDRPA